MAIDWKMSILYLSKYLKMMVREAFSRIHEIRRYIAKEDGKKIIENPKH